jgi:hypothetical protein
VGDWASGEIGVQSKESSCFFGKIKSCGVGKSDLDMLALIVAVADAPVQLGNCEGAPGDESSQMGARSGIARPVRIIGNVTKKPVLQKVRPLASL